MLFLYGFEQVYVIFSNDADVIELKSEKYHTTYRVNIRFYW